MGGYDNAISARLMTYSAPWEWDNVALALERLAAELARDDEAANILLTYARSWRNVLTNNHDPRRMRWLEAAVAAARRVGQPQDQANTLQAIGDVQNFRDERDAALESYRQALDLFRSVGSRLGKANTLLAQGDILRGQRQFTPAWEKYTQVRDLHARIGDRYSLARVLYRMGDWHAEQEQRQPAAELYRQAIDLWRSIGVDDLVEGILMPRLTRGDLAFYSPLETSND